MSSVPKLVKQTDFDGVLSSAPLLLVYFTAAWCGPCQQISPVIDQLSGNINNVTFLKIDIDQHKPLASRYQITSIPTFLLFHKGKELQRVLGADLPNLMKELTALSELEPAAQRVSVGVETPAVEIDQSIKELVPSGFSVLNGGIFYNELEYMNVEGSSDGVKSVLGKDNDHDSIHSDLDSQLLLHVPLINISKIHSVLIKAKEVEDFQRPSKLKLWINNNNIVSFDEAADLKSLNDTEDLSDWTEEGWCQLKLKFVRFQKVKSLDLFFDGDDEDTQTRIEKILFIGVDGESVKQGTISKE